MTPANERDSSPARRPSTRADALGLDLIDRAILRAMQRDGRITNAGLAAEVGISPAAMIERVRKLESKQIIRGYTALINPAAVGKNIAALVTVTLRDHGTKQLEDFKKAVTTFDEVQCCWHLAGESDFVLKVVATDMAEYEHFVVQRLSSVANIGRVRTSFCLNTVKESFSVPVPPEPARPAGHQVR